ncbi:class I SAM-dependent DNA methyltransferase [Parendozoicomonas haliclonae]|uniref:Ubiquinone/menaquinone biosynthesis methyltransferase n=1 Tax=Parendozoicomonas haliclonae TaxID=1960125 RepID=A0A1X7AIB1_9GAMM|nr:class I SAM-dependent methyltransferase [Parendozoicomonas haliclonae]SMA43474.1 ubiquinone/menaquinone biosynthesis methyltransferase [Parendozoicomonas haliclonae]
MARHSRFTLALSLLMAWLTQPVLAANTMQYSEQTAERYLHFNWLAKSLLEPVLQKALQDYHPATDTALALDYGCGTGIAIPYLKKAGYRVEGVDIEPNMLAAALTAHMDVPFTRITSGKIPRPENTYDLALASYVIVEIGDRDEIINIFKDIYRTLKPGGVLVVMGSSDERHNPDRQWASKDVDFPENRNRVSGSRVHSRYSKQDLDFYDYFWSTEDYRDFFTQSGFNLLEHQQPLATDDGRGYWKDELTIPATSLFVAQKPY